MRQYGFKRTPGVGKPVEEEHGSARGISLLDAGKLKARTHSNGIE